jgi:tagaturonate epimerase
MLELEKYSIGTGDRFGKQAGFQLEAAIRASEKNTEIGIIWNKSYREHAIIHTDPASVRTAADNAVKESGWKGSYYVDADHIGLKTVDLFMDSSDFFTLDVADFIGEKAPKKEVQKFVEENLIYNGKLDIPGIENPLIITEESIRQIAERYLFAAKEAGRIYRHIEEKKGKGNFITEVSMDETDLPQTPEELLFILSAVAKEGIPAQTIAPKFTGRFNKGVDYVGDLEKFDKEFNDDICIIAWAIDKFDLPENLKLSVHSGSDKFSIYPSIRNNIRKYNTGVHVKTAGTTWLEELIGLAESGPEGLVIAKEVYSSALNRYEELAEPYATVIDIDKEKLPTASEVESWTGKQYASALRHDQTKPDYNMHLRQLLHVGYKVASEMGDRYLDALVKNSEIVGRNVTENLYVRHIKPLFLN